MNMGDRNEDSDVPEALHLIASYGSDSEDDARFGDDDSSPRLPLPNDLIAMYINAGQDERVYNSEDYPRRVRVFPHERGNWCSLIYVPYENTSEFKAFTDMMIDTFYPVLDLEPINDLHVSLSRTFVLLHHWIDDFMESVKKTFANSDRFSLKFVGCKAYTNDQKNTTFLGLTVCPLSQPILQDCVNKIDNCLLEYKLQPFYEESSFHMSIACCLGNEKEKLDKLIAHFDGKINHILWRYVNLMKVNVDHLCAKVGNRLYELPLK